MRRLLDSVVPLLTIVLALVLVLIPWGIRADEWPLVRYLVPLTPLALVQYWIVRRPWSVPFALVFATGLVIDIATGGPLGFWALIYLLASAVVRLAGTQLHGSLAGRFVAFAAGFVLAAAVTWIVASGYYLRAMEVEPILAATATLILAYPALAALLWFTREPQRRQVNVSLDRGR